MDRKYIFSIMTIGLFVNNIFLKLVSSAAINNTELQLGNAAADFKNLGQNGILNLDNNKNSSSGHNFNSNTDNSSTDNTHPYDTIGHATGSFFGNVTGAAPRDTVGLVKGKIMALSDDVITDALFTNIDTLQDHVEICEEELRQKLKLYSYHQLFTESADDALNKDANEEKSESNDNLNVAGFDEHDEKYDDNIIKEATDDKPHQVSQKNPLPTRKRRFALITENGPPLRKFDIIARKVVERLSARMAYLRSSLVQCHLLVKQFG